jgi:hypothetical protein
VSLFVDFAVVLAGFLVGDRVLARYSTGSWTGKITDLRENNTTNGDAE